MTLTNLGSNRARNVSFVVLPDPIVKFVLNVLPVRLLITLSLIMPSGLEGSILVIIAVMGLARCPLPTTKLKKPVTGRTQLRADSSQSASRSI